MSLPKISFRPLAFAFSLVLCLNLALSTSSAQETESSGVKPVAERIAWWQDAKFGMFIHWGAYSKACLLYTSPSPRD